MANRRRLRIFGGVAAVILVGGGLGVYRWVDPFASDWAPACTDLAPRLTELTGTAWTQTKPAGKREDVGTALCEMAFVTPEGQLSGTALLYAHSEATDRETGRVELDSCLLLDAEPVNRPEGYDGYQVCSLSTTGHGATFAITGVKDERFVRLRMVVYSPTAETDEVAFTQGGELARVAVAESLAMPEPD